MYLSAPYLCTIIIETRINTKKMKTLNIELTKGATYTVVTSTSTTRKQASFYEANEATFVTRLSTSGLNWFDLSDGTSLYVSDRELFLGEIFFAESALDAAKKAAEWNTERALMQNEQAIKYQSWLNAKKAEAAAIWGE